MPSGGRLELGAIKLLFEALEAPKAIIAGVAARQYRRELDGLRSAQLVRPDGHIALGADDDDRPRELVWSTDTVGYGYFSESDGWVPVKDRDIEAYAIDVSCFLTLLTSKFSLAGVSSPRSILPGVLWDLGSARFGKRPRRSPVLFSRRMHEPSVCASVRAAILKLGLSERAALLTSTRADMVADIPQGCEVVSVPDVVSVENGLEIDPERIAARLSHRPVVGDKDLQIIAEGREVRFFGETFRFRRGLKQRDIICFLHDQLREGRDWVSSAEIVTELELPESTRVRDIFRGNPAWGRLLTEKEGMCGFCFDSNEPDENSSR